MGSPCLFTRQRGVKIRYFYCLRVKNSNHLHTEGNIALFRTVLWLAWSPRVGQNAPSWELYFSRRKKNRHVPLSNFFSSWNMFSIRLFLANTWKKIGGSPCSFKRKGEFISPSSGFIWGKSRTCTNSLARTNDAKIVRSRDAQCNKWTEKVVGDAWHLVVKD